MSWFNNIASKAKSVVKKAASTKFGKKVASIVKKAAPVVKKVVQSTPQYKTAKAVYKAVTPAKKSIQQVSKYIAPKVSTPAKSSSSKSSSSSKKSSSFSSKIQDVKNTVTTSLPKISDLGQSKAYASSTPTYGTPQPSLADKMSDVAAFIHPLGALAKQVSSTLAQQPIKYYGPGNWGGMPELGAMEFVTKLLGLKPNTTSLENAQRRASGEWLPGGNFGGINDTSLLNAFNSNPNAPITSGVNLSGVTFPSDTGSKVLGSNYSALPTSLTQPGGSMQFSDPRKLAQPGAVQGISDKQMQTDLPPTNQQLPTDQQLPPANTQEPYVDPMTKIFNEIDPSGKLAEWVTLANDGNQQPYDELLKSNFADSEKFTNTWSENQKQQLELAYRKLKENYGNMSDEERRIADSALNRIQAELDMLYGEGRKATQSVENTYGEAERARIKKAKLDEANARNLFSSLGTAESSSFIDKLMDLKQEGGRESYRADVEKAGKIADINDLINRSKVDAGNQKNEIITTRDRNIQSIQSQMNMSQQEKDYAIMEQNLLALQQMMQLQQQDQANRLAFLNNRMTAKSGTDQIMLQGIINNALLNKGYNIAG